MMETIMKWWGRMVDKWSSNAYPVNGKDQLDVYMSQNDRVARDRIKRKLIKAKRNAAKPYHLTSSRTRRGYKYIPQSKR